MAKRRDGTSTISTKHQVTLPIAVMRAAHLRAGDSVRFEIDGDGRIVGTPLPQPRDTTRFIGLWRAGARYGSGAEAIEDLRGPVEP